MSLTPAHESLFKAWLEEHRGIVVKVTCAFAPNAIDAADLEQELLLQLWIAVPSYAGQAKPSTWIYRVCLNTALTWRRGAARREKRMEPGIDLSQLAAPSPSPADSAGQRELLEQLYAAIRTMSDFDRVLILLSLDGLAYREIAEVTGLTENHVGVVLTRARQHVAKLMKGIIDELE
jgi:RNA polymerase sigma-70 factor (ECF subfamily)